MELFPLPLTPVKILTLGLKANVNLAWVVKFTSSNFSMAPVENVGLDGTKGRFEAISNSNWSQPG
jgi:hypothetical protein